MQIFTDILRRHYEQQPRFAPTAALPEPNAPPPAPALVAADQLKNRLMKLLAETPAHKSITQAGGGSSNSGNSSSSSAPPGTQDLPNKASSSSQRDLISTTGREQPTAGSDVDISSLQAKQSKTAFLSAANNTTSEQFNKLSPSADQQPIVAVKLLEDSDQIETPAQPPASAPKGTQLERLQLEEISKLLAQQRQRNLEQLQQLQPDQQDQQIQQQYSAQTEDLLRTSSISERAKGMAPQPAASPANRPVRATTLAKVAKLAAKTTKESNGPSLTQTPTPTVGGSASLNQTNNNRAGPKPNQKKISISRIIAEQTPNAFKTLVNVKNPGEHSGHGHRDGAPGRPGSAMDAVPSDYEHIFHYPSNMVDEPHSGQGAKVRHNDKNKQDNRQHHQARANTNANANANANQKNHLIKQNKKPKRQGAGNRQQDTNRKQK